MSLPKNELGITVPNFIEKIHCDHVYDVLATANYNQYDMVIEGTPDHYLCGIADNAIAIGTYGSIHAEEGIQIQSDNAHAGEVFNTWGQQVYYDLITKEYYATPQAGFFNVGIIIRVQNTEGVFVFEKYRYATIEPTT